MSIELAALAVVALIAFTIEGAIGFGATVIAASIGAQLVPLDELLPAFVPVNMVLSAWLVASSWRAIAWRMLGVEIAPMVGLGAIVGLALFHVPAKTALALAFGVFVVGLAALQLGGAIALAVVPGLVIGERIHRALDTARFERVVWIGLAVAGAALAVRNAFAL